jgi:homoserine kinase
MKINSFNTARFRNAEIVSVTADVLNFVSGYDWVGLKVEGFYTQTITSLKKLEDHLNKFNTVSETLQVEENDLLFNNSWRALKYF